VAVNIRGFPQVVDKNIIKVCVVNKVILLFRSKRFFPPPIAKIKRALIFAPAFESIGEKILENRSWAIAG